MKQLVRSFSAGILISTLLLAAGHYLHLKEKTTPEPQKDAISNSDMVNQLETAGYTILPPGSELKGGTQSETEKQEPQVIKEETEVITIHIKKDFSFSDLTLKLDHAGIVEDTEAFSYYMNTKGYSKNIQLGEFQIKNGMSYKEIAETLTRQ